MDGATDQLFRRESGRMIAVLTRVFGAPNLDLAEEVVQETFCRALDIWPYRGVPENPSAWLMLTAKNRAFDMLRRQRTARTHAAELGRLLDSEWALSSTLDEQFGSVAITDDLLRMMFSCCHPRLPQEAQVALILNILCGFSMKEIAGAFVCTDAAIGKRITRGKSAFTSATTLFELSEKAIANRLPAVQRALYQLFNEGYHGASAEKAVRIELCREAMRLTALLLAHPLGATPTSFALAALMSLHAARLPSRLNEFGHLITLFEQDRSKWDRELLAEGLQLLGMSASGDELSEYHIEAAIAAMHGRAEQAEDTNWSAIVTLYDSLMNLRPSPIVALSRAIAIGQRDGAERGIEAIRAIADRERLASYPFYAAAMGEFESKCGAHTVARDHYLKALAAARNPMERRFFQDRADRCAAQIGSES